MPGLRDLAVEGVLCEEFVPVSSLGLEGRDLFFFLSKIRFLPTGTTVVVVLGKVANIALPLILATVLVRKPRISLKVAE